MGAVTVVVAVVVVVAVSPLRLRGLPPQDTVGRVGVDIVRVVAAMGVGVRGVAIVVVV